MVNSPKGFLRYTRINNITEHEWLWYFTALWTDKNINRGNDIYENHRGYVDHVTSEELNNALERFKYRKARGSDSINIELYTYGGLLLKHCLLHLYNNYWYHAKTSSKWQISIVQPIFEKKRKHHNGLYTFHTSLFWVIVDSFFCNYTCTYIYI